MCPADARQKTASNRLIDEKSPYLIQHAGNPVNWYPWGKDAFDKARKEDKPVFLSIGYSTCHWCHVMAHESFEDEEVALLFFKNPNSPPLHSGAAVSPRAQAKKTTGLLLGRSKKHPLPVNGYD